MKCSCGSSDTKVIDVSHSVSLNIIRRRRECEKCGNRFTTVEISKDDIGFLIDVEKSMKLIEEESKEVEKRRSNIRAAKKDVQKIRTQIYGKYRTMLQEHIQRTPEASNE